LDPSHINYRRTFVIRSRPLGIVVTVSGAVMTCGDVGSANRAAPKRAGLVVNAAVVGVVVVTIVLPLALAMLVVTTRFVGFLQVATAAVIIGDVALFLDPSAICNPQSAIQKLDLGALWTRSTGLPFVYAFWAGWPDAVTPEQVEALQRARDAGVAHAADVARAYYPDDPARESIARRYLRDNIKYGLGPEERAGLDLFYRYAAEIGVVPATSDLRFYGQV